MTNFARNGYKLRTEIIFIVVLSKLRNLNKLSKFDLFLLFILTSIPYSVLCLWNSMGCELISTCCHHSKILGLTHVGELLISKSTLLLLF